MRKFLCMILVLSLVLGMGTAAFAGEAQKEFLLGEESIYEHSQTLSEYDILKELMAMSDQQLKVKGYQTRDIAEIRSIDFEKIVEKLKNSSDKELKEMGFTAEKIMLVRKSNDSAVILSQTMGSVTYRINKLRYEYNSATKITNLVTNFTWEWSSRPLVEFIDIVACGTNLNYGRLPSYGGTSSKTVVQYYKNGNKSTTPKSKTIEQGTIDNGTKTYSRFSLKAPYASSNPDRPDLYYAMKGQMIVAWEVAGIKNSTSIAGNYGHSTVSIANPSLAAGKGGLTLSFTPSVSVQSGVEDQIVVRMQ